MTGCRCEEPAVGDANGRIETLRLVSRGYELGSNGLLSIASYLRYLEHARWLVNARSRKLPLGRFFSSSVVRSQVLELYRSVSLHVALELSVWVSRVGRTSMELSHEITRVADGELVARSTAVVVAVDSKQRPVALGEGALEFLAGGRRTAETELPFEPPPKDAWKRDILVRPSDCDVLNHVNHARFADLIEDALTPWALGDETFNAGEPPVRRFSIGYEQPARSGDALVARAWQAQGRDRTVDCVLTRGTDSVLVRSRVELATS